MMPLAIPITVWDRDRGDTVNDMTDTEARKGVYRFTFGGGWSPIPNFLGEDRQWIIDQVVDQLGFTILLKKATWRPDHSVQVEVELLNVPEGNGAGTAVPLLIIIGAIAAIGGGILILAILSKVEALFNLPIFWLVAAAAVFAALPGALRALKGVGS